MPQFIGNKANKRHARSMLSQKIGAGSTGWELVTGVGDLAGARRRFEFQAKRSRKRVTEQRTAERYPGGARDAPPS